jgi:hypothetical protein
MTDWLTDPRWERIAAASGIGAVIFFVISYILAGKAPGIDEGAATITSYFGDDRSLMLWSGVLQGLGSVLFIWFFAALVTAIRDAGQSRLATAAFAGGILTIGVGGIGYVMSQALAHSIAKGGDATAITTVYTIEWIAYGATAFPLAVMAWATGTAIIKSRVLPEVLGWASMAGAIWLVIGGAALKESGFFSPSGTYGLISYFVFLAWTLVVSAALTQRVAATTEAPRPATAAG